MRRFLQVALSVALLTGFATIPAAAPEAPSALPAPPAAAPAVLRPAPTPADAVLDADLDAQALLAADPFGLEIDTSVVRWLWVERSTEDELKTELRAASYTLRLVDRASSMVRPLPVANGRLLRIDLSLLFPDPKDLREALALWESFRFDPAFHEIVTPQQVELLTGEVAEQTVADVGRHVDRVAWYRLVELTASDAPVVNWDYFLLRATTAIRSKQPLYRDLYDGLYYQLTGIPDTLDAFYEKFCGIGNAKAGLTADQQFEQLRSDRAVLLTRRTLNSKRSRVLFYPSLAVLGGITVRTEDTKDDSIDVDQNPALNLLHFIPDAYETITDKKGGGHLFGLWNKQKKRLDEAANDVAQDRTVPAGHQPRLQAGISCIRCHGPEEGWQPLVNDARDFNRVGPQFDLREQGRSPADLFDRLRGLYGYDPANDLRLAKDRYNAAVLETAVSWVDPILHPERHNKDAAKLSTAAVADSFAHYWYDGIGAKKALYEMGIDCPTPEIALATLKAVLPPLGPGREDRRIEDLLAGKEIGRTEWDLVRAPTTVRVQGALKALLQNQKGKP